MRTLLRRYENGTDSRYLVLANAGNMFIMPKFRHLMMDNTLIEVDIPDDYYSINKEAIDSMASSTQKFICNLIERV